ncbi:Uncharacterised protein [Mycobacteroides abscessus subsp. abscessus]|uniref:hypothetical protein n=1 Tax=Mycobacteroides abscessus TaxID=36809 RepID=UPI000929D018|nr:hypothetical protein [Mycobacteroides abscessus]SIJ21157.1 Uncharacterised protein [Mycobacteroides abscessus subsp. abscessus]SLH39311.1 Uncharacterised protein [Mycobacteroides abscessus subsp. abscessus]
MSRVSPRPVRLYPLRDLPYPHTFRDEEITEFMSATYRPDALGRNCFQKAHEKAFVEQHPEYLTAMRAALTSFHNVGHVCARAVQLVQLHGDAVSEVVDEMQPRPRRLWEWLSLFPITFRGDELGDGQHRVTALRLFADPDLLVPAVRIART